MATPPLKLPGGTEGLTVSEMEFANLILAGESQSSAYRQVYGGEVTKNLTARKASSQGRLIMRRPHVLAYVTEKREELELMALWTRVDSVKTLASIARSREKYVENMKRLNEENAKRAKVLAAAERDGVEVELPPAEMDPLDVEPPASYSDITNAVKELNRMYGWEKMTIDVISSDRSMSPPSRVEYEIIEPGQFEEIEE